MKKTRKFTFYVFMGIIILFVVNGLIITACASKPPEKPEEKPAIIVNRDPFRGKTISLGDNLLSFKRDTINQRDIFGASVWKEAKTANELIVNSHNPDTLVDGMKYAASLHGGDYKFDEQNLYLNYGYHESGYQNRYISVNITLKYETRADGIMLTIQGDSISSDNIYSSFWNNVSGFWSYVNTSAYTRSLIRPARGL
jgi:hypothetical protein